MVGAAVGARGKSIGKGFGRIPYIGKADPSRKAGRVLHGSVYLNGLAAGVHAMGCRVNDDMGYGVRTPGCISMRDLYTKLGGPISKIPSTDDGIGLPAIVRDKGHRFSISLANGVTETRIAGVSMLSHAPGQGKQTDRCQEVEFVSHTHMYARCLG
jgi:hypothetical protein